MAEQHLESRTDKNPFVRFLSTKANLRRQATEQSPEHSNERSLQPVHSLSIVEDINAAPAIPEAASSISSPPAKIPSPQALPPHRPKPWRWSLLWLALLGVFGGMGTAAVIWLVTLPPPINCEEPAKLSLDGERLFCAREAAQSGELSKIIAGLDLVKQWDTDHPLQSEAKRLQEEWSKQLLRIARDKVMQSDMKGAIAILSHVPKTTKTYAEAQEMLAYWNKQWQAGETIVAKAQAAMKQQKWDDAYEQIKLLDDFSQDYWRVTRAGALAQQLGAERQAWQVLSQARKAAGEGTAPQLNQAIVLALQVPPKTFAEAESKTQIRQWGLTLLSIGVEKWKQGDTTGAASMLRLPDGTKPTAELADLIQFGNAYRLVSQVNSRWLPTLSQIWDMTEAVASIQQIKPDSPFYEQAKIHQQNWQAQRQDLIQLQYAAAAASLGQRSSLQLAIAQAQEVGIDRPRRKQAQTLISYWADEIERMEDQPYLIRAEHLAKSGKIPDLQAAIAQASHIAKGRALRGRSQDLIATWRDQIETIEDQPTLDQSIALANQGDLDAAVARATTIAEDRALYAKAQELVAEWQAQQIINAQIAADQPILDRARAQASSGDLSGAISTAAQISPGRALYSDAQGEIDRWQQELAPPPVEIPPIDLATPSPDPTSEALPTDTSIDVPPPGSASGTDDSSSDEDESDSLTAPSIIVEPEPLSPSPAGPPPDEDRSIRPRASYDGYYDERYYQNDR